MSADLISRGQSAKNAEFTEENMFHRMGSGSSDASSLRGDRSITNRLSLLKSVFSDKQNIVITTISR